VSPSFCKSLPHQYHTSRQTLRELESENADLKRTLSEREMAIDTLKEINRRKW